MPALRPRRRVLLLALALDATLGEPPSGLHPVVWMGTAINCLGRRAPASPMSQLFYGACQAAAVAGGTFAVTALAMRGVRHLPEPLATIAEACLLKSMVSVRALIVAARAVGCALASDDLSAARSEVRALVSRPAAELSAPQLVGAAVESVAENAIDSIVAPVLYYVIAGVPGAALYRAVNTLDAMVGYRGDYEYLGKVAARTDDLLNLVPARLGTLLLIAAAAMVEADARRALATLRTDRGLTASPNAGWPMSAMAGALGVRLEKPGTYCLGETFDEPHAASIERAIEMVVAATLLITAIACCAISLRRRRA